MTANQHQSDRDAHWNNQLPPGEAVDPPRKATDAVEIDPAEQDQQQHCYGMASKAEFFATVVLDG